MTGMLLDYLDIHLPCNSTCPIEYGQLKDCRLSPEKDKLFMDFVVPMVHGQLLVVEADAFTLAQVDGNQTCSVECGVRRSYQRRSLRE